MGIDRSISDTPVGVRKQGCKETLIDGKPGFGVERVVMSDGGSMIILPPGTETIIEGWRDGTACKKHEFKPEPCPRGVHKTMGIKPGSEKSWEKSYIDGTACWPEIIEFSKKYVLVDGTACKHSGI